MSRKSRQDRAQRRAQQVFAFRTCPGCNYDFISGEGSRSCSWHDCPYLPEELKVFCPECNYNFATREGNPHCSDPPSCDWAVEGYRHAQTVRAWAERAGIDGSKARLPGRP